MKINSTLKPKVFVAMSGGVDSSLAAALLKEQGYSVRGVYMKNWSNTDPLQCPWQEEIDTAAAVAAHLGIPFESWHLEEEYRAQVVAEMIAEYKAGRTPNPDITCNEKIKFGVFLEKAWERGADYVATGHYVRLVAEIPSSKSQIPNKSQIPILRQAQDRFSNFQTNPNYSIIQFLNCHSEAPEGTEESLQAALRDSSSPPEADPQNDRKKFEYRLLRAVDHNKDQSYFLYRLNQDQLKHCLFPIGHLTKPQVREEAKKRGLPNWARKDSQGLCFVGKVKMPEFLGQFLKPKKGVIKTVDGKIIGEHQGVWYFTRGQRHFSSCGGTGRLYVTDRNLETNTLVVAPKNHPSLYAARITIVDCHWITGLASVLPLKCQGVIRYRQKPTQCVMHTLSRCEKPRLKRGDEATPSLSVKARDCFGLLSGPRNDTKEWVVEFQEPQWAPAAGQSVVLYQGEEMLGGGVIEEWE